MKLLLHACCAPCFAYFLKHFGEKGTDYTVYHYNPNIHPYKEYLRRYETLKNFTEKKGIPLLYDVGFMQAKWEKDYQKLEQKQRCSQCYAQRLMKTAEVAAREGFTHFSSTMFISPYQNHEIMKKIANDAAQKYGVQFYYEDFRIHFREGQQLAKEANLYRQKYCGCICSYMESKYIEKINWD